MPPSADAEPRASRTALCRRGPPRFRTLRAGVDDVLGPHVDGLPVFKLWRSPVHGAAHFARVGALALALHRRRGSGGAAAAELPGTGATEAVLLAVFFHDSGRTNEYRDSGHGKAGERIFEAFAGRAVPAPDPAVRRVVSGAILYHCGGGIGTPGGVAMAIANADRLDRVRFGDRPRADLMCADGVWSAFAPLASDFVRLVDDARVLREIA